MIPDPVFRLAAGPLSGEPLPEFDESTLELCEREAAASLLYLRLKRAGRLSELAPDVRDTWSNLYRTVAGQNVHKWHFLGPVLHRLEEKGIPVALLKGVVQNERIYRSAGARGMTDVDVLIRPEDLTAAAEIIEGAEFRPRTPWPEAGPECSGSLNSQMYTHRSAIPPVRLHLHWDLINASVPLQQFYRPWDVAELLERSIPVTVMEWELRGLDPVDHALHELEHALKHGYAPLIHAVDAWHAVDAVEDRDQLEERIRKMNLGWAVYGLDEIARRYGWPATRLSVPRPRGWSLRHFRHRIRGNRRGGVTALLGLLGMAGSPTRQWRCVRQLLWPSRKDAERYGWREKGGRTTPRLKRLAWGLASAVRQIL